MNEKEWLIKFSSNLSKLIEDSGYSKQEICDKAMISKSTLSKYLNAKQMPEFKPVFNLAHALNLRVSNLICFSNRIE